MGVSNLTGARSPSIDARYRTEYQRLVALAAFLLGSGQSAEDVVQDAFIALGARGLEAIDAPAGYLTTIVVNGCKRHLRTNGRVSPREVLDLPPSTDERLVEFVSLLGQLSERKRPVVVLRYWAGFTTEEIASYLGCRPGTVGSLLHRAINDLKGRER